jgi:hypothetical protein
MGAALILDGNVEGKIRLERIDESRKCDTLTAPRKSGQAKIQLVFSVAPFIGNGEFTIAMELHHPVFDSGKRTFKVAAEVRDTPRKLQRTFNLP